MITTTIALSSNPASTLIYEDIVYLSNTAEVTLDFSNIDITRVLASIKLRWGDNTTDEFYTNNFFPDYTEVSILDEIQYGITYTILVPYTHTYYPSDISLTKQLSCQALATYVNGVSCRWVIPITLYSPSYHTKIGDMELIQTNIIDTNKSMLYTFATQAEGYIIETVLDNTPG